MTLAVHCPECEQRMLVPLRYVARRVKCANCTHRFVVEPLKLGGAEPAAWFVRTADGQEHGPLSPGQVGEWIQSTRLTADCQVLVQGWKQWQWADTLFPELPGASAGASTPFDSLELAQGDGPGELAAQEVPAASPARLSATSPGARRAMQVTHRWLVLLLIMGLTLYGALFAVSLFAGGQAFAQGDGMALARATILLLASSLFILVPILYAWQYDRRIREYLRKDSQYTLQTALEGQMYFFRALCWVPLVSLFLAVVGTAIAFGNGLPLRELLPWDR